MRYDPNGHSAILIGLIIGAIVGVSIGFTTASYIDYRDDGKVFNGSVAWYDYLGASIAGGVIGEGVGAGFGYALPYIQTFAESAFSLGFGLSSSGSGVAAVTGGITITGAQVLKWLGLVIGMGIMYSIPMHGDPNTSISNQNGSYGEYDSNGNLSYRVDVKGKPHYIKSVRRHCLPHTHKFTWKVVDGIWRYIEEVLPYII